jgi:hypothetical protein
MNPRIIAAIFLATILVAMFAFGPEQYGYPFMGLLAGIGAFARIIGAESPMWMFVFPIASITLIIAFSVIGLSSVIYLILCIAAYPKWTSFFRKASLIPLGFSALLIAGLLLFKALPGEPPIQFSPLLFVAPSLLLIVAIIYSITINSAEQDAAANP